MVRRPIRLQRLSELAQAVFGDFVKGVVDLGRGVMAVGGELHVDSESALLDDGSGQSDLWGVNLYPARHPEEGWIEFDSVINLRPQDGNLSRSVDDPSRRARIIELIEQLVEP